MIVTPRNQPPLPVELRPERPARLSYTWLSHYDRCKHSAYLYTQFGGGPGSGKMDRGSLFHDTVKRLTTDAMENGEVEVPAEVAKAALLEVYAEGRYTVPAGEWDYLRRCVFNWATNTVLNPEEILGVEQLVVWDVGGWRISGKFDLAWMRGSTVGVRDYKTAPSPDTKEEWEQGFQCKDYALLLAFGSPVTVRDCLKCDGGGEWFNADGQSESCEDCHGKGYTETLEQYPLGHGAQHFDIAEVYPGLAFDDGGLMERRRVLSRAELLDEKGMLESLLAQVSQSFDSGEWPAVPSDDACGKCPARRACPLPDVLLPFAAIEAEHQAEHFAMAMELLDRERKEIVKSLKAWVKPGRPIDLGNGTQLNFVKQEVDETDYKGFKTAQLEGKVVDLEQFKSRRIQTRFVPEPIPEPEPTADEKWGDTLPTEEDAA